MDALAEQIDGLVATIRRVHKDADIVQVGRELSIGYDAGWFVRVRLPKRNKAYRTMGSRKEYVEVAGYTLDEVMVSLNKACHFHRTGALPLEPIAHNHFGELFKPDTCPGCAMIK